MDKLRIGFFGTGTMGKPMARSLLLKGFPLSVWNRTPQRYAELVAEGASAPGTARAVAAVSDVLITVLEESAHVDAILEGPEGILAGVQPNSIFINMGTNRPRHARHLAELFAARSVTALDAPVRGGVEAAIDGTLLIMVGGPREAFERVLPVFEAMGSKVVYAGPAGSGQVAKACLQIVVATTIESVAEAMALAQSFGADGKGIRDVLLASQTASTQVERQASRILEGDWNAGRQLNDFLKDRANIADALTGTRLRLPLTQAIFERINDIAESGKGELREAALYTLLEP